jgi:hypothetical protein
MAFYNDQDEENQTDPNQGPQTGPETGIIGADGGSGGGSSSPKAAGSPDKGGNFVGLQTYLNANKPQAAKLGEQTAGVVASSADQARNQITGLNTQFNQDVDKNTINKDETATNQIGAGAETLDADQRNQLKKQYNAQYRGPSGLADYGDKYTGAVGASNKANQNLAAAQTEEGRGTLINQINSAPRTQGVTTFDNILLQKGVGRDKLDQVVNQNKDLKDMLSKAEQDAVTKVGRVDDPTTPDIDESAGAIGTTAKTKADTNKSVQDALNAWKGGFDTRLKEAQDTGLQNRITEDLGDGNNYFSEETMNQLGLNPNDTLFHVNPNDYINPFSASDITPSNLATTSDYNRYGALADIAGIQDPYLNQANIGQAGTAPGFSVNKQGFLNDLAAAKNNYENIYANDRTRLNRSEVPYLDSDYMGSTIKEMVENLIPQQAAKPGWGNQEMAEAMRQYLKRFQDSQGYNNRVLSQVQQFNPTTSIKG